MKRLNEVPQCKVKIGCSYEPTWFERRQTNGWYSAKNAPLDKETSWIQNALLHRQSNTRVWTAKIITTLALVAVLAYVAWIYGVFK